MKITSPQNRLAHETSPYLLQHSTNPVDWYAWNQEALRKAKSEDKPIFLSIGYSACHWCHVMERESFEDLETAKILNEHFISIKVDREERPDLDQIYMSAVQIMTHHGGWPMSVFLTPNLEPFYGGTYFPPEDRMGLPSFKRILSGVANAWKTKRDELERSATELVIALKEMNGINQEAAGSLSLEALNEAALHLIKKSYDAVHGGLGNAPKFFHTMDMRLALRHWKNTQSEEALNLVLHTLEQWSRGGIFDHLAGAFHRYSTDRQWLVPHFEKMLYDNALLTQLYLEAYQIKKDISLAKTARETLDYIALEMTSPLGLFFSTLDADSEGVEGKYYVWSHSEINQILSPDIAEIFSKTYGVTEHGNWEESNILNRTESWEDLSKTFGLSTSELEETLAVAKRKLLAQRKNRIAPFRDEKILTSWNSMMIESFCLAFQTLEDDNYLQIAQKAGSAIWKNLWDGPTKELKHCFAEGLARQDGFLEDYACLLNAFISLYESDFDEKWLAYSELISERITTLFWDPTSLQFFFTPLGAETLILRPTETHDGATPSSVSMALTGLVRFAKITSKDSILKICEKAFKVLEPNMRMLPNASGQLLIALQLLMRGKEIVVVPGSRPGNDKEELDLYLRELRENFNPNKVVTQKSAEKAGFALFKDRIAVNGKTTLYVCQNQTCGLPIQSLEALKTELAK